MGKKNLKPRNLFQANVIIKIFLQRLGVLAIGYAFQCPSKWVQDIFEEHFSMSVLKCP